MKGMGRAQLRAVVLLYATVTAVLFSCTKAAVRVNARDRLASFHGNVPRHIRYKRSTGSLADIFGLSDGETFEIQAETTTAQGTKQLKLVEKYRGKDVFDTVVTLTTDGQTPLDAQGHFVQDIHKDVYRKAPSLKKNELFDILIRHFKDEKRVNDIGSRKLRRDFYVDDNGLAHRVAMLEYLIQNRHVQKRPTGIINIKTGEIIRAWDNLATCRSYMRGRVFGGNRKIGKIKYGISPTCLDLKQRRGMCFLENKHVKVVDMYNTELDYLTQTAKFYCFHRYGDRINGAYSPALDALYHGTIVGKMFEEWFDSKPLKKKMILRVHYSHLFTNAFWNGHNCSFGDGIPGVSYPFTSLDIIGHEIAHGITEQNSQLMYLGEAGAINEAFSDITGEMAELYADTIDWRVGYAIQVDGSMRYFDNRSLSHVSDYRDDMNTHDTSGIFNHVFYLLAHEYGLSPPDVYRVFLHANRMYWHPMTNFRTGACDVMLSAYDLGQPGEPFARAFTRVGIEPCDIEDHVHHLRHNNTLFNVTVSNTTMPVFGLEIPTWGDSVHINASSLQSDIYIRVYQNKWTEITDSTPTIAEGYDVVQYKLPLRYHNHSCLIQLSTKSPKPIKDVQIRGGYSCVSYYRTRNRQKNAYYLWDCHGIDVGPI
ncbi:elastase-like isoform X1 [Haliotis rufescens]|uniref:elastase-like isoform X1 n=1 Tax=Haliotis rufescens TaxID=6454 RepID=UPI00201EEEDF|nr:elastase-like isoform X1 [Haliotis rufescens]